MEKLEKFQLLLACTIISTGILLSSFVFATKIDKNENITVTGSASKIVKSDSASLTFAIRTNAINQKEAFSNIKKQSPKAARRCSNLSRDAASAGGKHFASISGDALKFDIVSSYAELSELLMK